MTAVDSIIVSYSLLSLHGKFLWYMKLFKPDNVGRIDPNDLHVCVNKTYFYNGNNSALLQFVDFITLKARSLYQDSQNIAIDFKPSLAYRALEQTVHLSPQR